MLQIENNNDERITMRFLLLTFLFFGIANSVIAASVQEERSLLKKQLIEKCKHETELFITKSEEFVSFTKFDKYVFYTNDHPKFAPPLKIEEKQIETSLTKEGNFRLSLDYELTNQRGCLRHTTYICSIEYRNANWKIHFNTARNGYWLCSD